MEKKRGARGGKALIGEEVGGEDNNNNNNNKGFFWGEGGEGG